MISIPQRIVRPSVARVSEQSDQRFALISHTLGFTLQSDMLVLHAWVYPSFKKPGISGVVDMIQSCTTSRSVAGPWTAAFRRWNRWDSWPWRWRCLDPATLWRRRSTCRSAAWPGTSRRQPCRTSPRDRHRPPVPGRWRSPGTLYTPNSHCIYCPLVVYCRI